MAVFHNFSKFSLLEQCSAEITTLTDFGPEETRRGQVVGISEYFPQT